MPATTPNKTPNPLLTVSHDDHNHTMPRENSTSAIPLLARALQRIRSTPPRMIASPPTRTPPICLFLLR